MAGGPAPAASRTRSSPSSRGSSPTAVRRERVAGATAIAVEIVRNNRPGRLCRRSPRWVVERFFAWIAATAASRRTRGNPRFARVFLDAALHHAADPTARAIRMSFELDFSGFRNPAPATRRQGWHRRQIPGTGSSNFHLLAHDLKRILMHHGVWTFSTARTG